MNSPVPVAFTAHLRSLLLVREGNDIARGRGVLHVGTDGDIRIEYPVDDIAQVFTLGADTAKYAIAGETSDGFTLSAAHAGVKGSTLRAGVTQPTQACLFFTALEVTLARNGHTPQTWTRKILSIKGPSVHAPQTWEHAGYRFELRRTGLSKTPASGEISAELSIERLQSPATDYENIRHGVLELLSLVSRVRCGLVLEHTYLDDALVSVAALWQTGGEQATHPLVLASHVGSFMQSSLPEYLMQREQYGLQTVVAHYCRSHEES